MNKKTSWRDTNLAFFGSDLEKKIKQAAANTEDQWKNVGRQVELRVWRIEQFVVKPWPKRKYGKFHKGDSYVILNTYKPNPSKPKLKHDIHIWIGHESSQDEYGTAAYKMVELDDKFGGVAVQHREVQEKESSLFLSYFNNKISYLEGGVESGFHHVDQDATPEPQLYRVKGTSKNQTLRLTQVPVRRDSMNSGDVFVLVVGDDKVWMWVGSQANRDEKTKGMEVARAFCSKGSVKVLDQGVNDGENEASGFWHFMPSHVSSLGVFKKSLHVQDADNKDDKGSAFVPVLYQVPKSGGTGSMKKIAIAKQMPVGPSKDLQPQFARSILNSQIGVLLDTGFHVYVWLGKKADSKTKSMAVPQSHEYFKLYKRPILPVTVLKEGQETPSFKQFFYDASTDTLCASCTIL